MVKIAIIAFLLMTVQSLMAARQVQGYKKAIDALKGKGLLGIGARKGILKAGQIVIVSLDRAEGKINGCKILRGITVFEKFKDATEYIGLTLDQLREIAIKEDAEINKKMRIKKPYDPTVPDRKKAALIQAVEAIDYRIIQDSKKEEQKVLEDFVTT